MARARVGGAGAAIPLLAKGSSLPGSGPGPPAAPRPQGLTSASGSAVSMSLSGLNSLRLGCDLRGIEVCELFSDAARVFANRGELARRDPHGTYARSTTVDSISYFCSHSWSSHRWHKYLGLLLHFNLGPACVATAAANFGFFACQVFWPDAFPEWTRLSVPIIVDYEQGTTMVLCCTAAPLVFVAALFGSHLLLHRHTFTSIFVDVCCIPQHDPAAKAAGISSLGAVLSRSERMIALCDGEYFTRLWCIFELAAFTKQAGASTSRLHLLPLHSPIIVLSVCCIAAVTYLVQSVIIACFPHAYSASVSSPMNLVVEFLCVTSPCCVASFAAFREARRIRRALRNLKDFSLDKVYCTSDDDRKLLLATIGEWWADEAHPDANPLARRRLGMERFEGYVRFELAPKLRDSMGVLGIDRLGYLGIWLTLLLGNVYDWISQPQATLLHVLALLALTAVATVLLPVWIGALQLGSDLYYWARTWTRVDHTFANACAVLLGGSTCALVQGFLLWVCVVLVFPNLFFGDAYSLPDDHLDDTARRCAKFWIVVVLNSIVTLILRTS